MDNQTRLLDVALSLFSQRGYAAVGVQEVVEAAGLTKPTLYHYFGSKRGLLEALLAREFEPMMFAVSQADVYEGDLVHTLEGLTRAYFKVAKDTPAFYRMSLAMRYSPPESETYQVILPYARHQQQILEKVFIQAAEDHGNMHGRHRRYAVGFLGGIHAAIGLSFQGEWELEDQVVYQLVHQFMHGIFS
jgi:AcrR family transcriptional regulator